MKKPLFLIMFCLCVAKLSAQDVSFYDSTGMPYQEQIVHIFEHVDLSQVPNGILYEHGFPLQNFDLYQGQLSDTNKTDFTAFGLLYASLYSMALNPDVRLPDPSTYRTIVDGWKEGNPVLIAGIHHQYYQLNPEALNLNLMQVNNMQLYDVLNRSQSPYEAKEVFLLAPNMNTYKGTALRVKFTSALFYKNTNKELASLQELDEKS
jgi:hypothetical protein